MPRRYERPFVTRVDLKPEEAVLAGCKFQGSTDPGFQRVGLGGCYQTQTSPRQYYLCQQAGT
jgi:hypothetical protein